MSTGQILGRTADSEGQNTRLFLTGTLANRPAAGTVDRYYIANDTGNKGLYRDIGTAWETILSSSADVGTAELSDFNLTDDGGLVISLAAGAFTENTTTTAIGAYSTTLTDDATNYIEINTATPAISVNTSAFTAGNAPLWQVVTASGDITSTTDKRAWLSAGVNVPSTSTDNTVPRYSGTSGRVLQGSGVVVDDSDNVSGVVNLTTTGTVDHSAGTFNASNVNAGTLTHERGGLEADVSAYAGLVRIDSGSTTNITNVQGLNTALGATLYSNGAMIRRTFFTTTSVTEGATRVNLQFPSTSIEGVNRRANEVVITEFTVTPTNPGGADVTDVDVTLYDQDTGGATVEQWNAWDPSGGALVDKGKIHYWDTDDTGELHITIVEQNGATSYTYTVTVVGYILHTVNV